MNYIQQHIKKQKNIFNKEYIKIKDYYLQNWRISYLKRIFSALDLKPSDLLLDIGVGGSGYTIIEAAKEGVKAIGIDISFEGIKKAKSSARVINRGNLKLCNFLVSSAEFLPFPNKYFTKVCSIAVLEHIGDDSKAINEISRVIKKQGKIFISVPNSYETMPFIYTILNKINDKRVGHLRHYKSSELIKEFEKKGFILNDLTYHAHKVKILQYILSIVFPPVRKKNSKIWWWLEELDLKQKNNPRSMSFSITMTKIN